MTTNRIVRGDSLQLLKTEIDDGSIDLIFSDPPYNLSGSSLDLANNTTGGAFYKVNEAWDTFTQSEYLSFTKAWIKESYRALKMGGSLYISCTHHNIGELVLTGKEIGFKLNNILTWYKTNAMPNITKRTFTHSTEFVLWFVKGSGWTFNYDRVKALNPNKTKEGKPKQMRDFWDFLELPIVQGRERLKGTGNRALHPTQKPEKLLEIIIEASSNAGDIVLDPFLGTGTTAVVAERLGRRWIGFDLSEEYTAAAAKRIENERRNKTA